MEERWLRNRSGTRDEESFDNADNVDLDSNSTYLESETNITVRANPIVEGGVQNSEVAAHDSNNATLSNITTLQLQDLLATVMTAIQAESSTQMAAVKTDVAKLAKTLKAQFRQKNEKFATSLTVRLELILNEQLYNKLSLLGLNCLELLTQHLNLVSAFNERSKRIRKQALLEIRIGDNTVDQVVLLSSQLLTDAILGLDFLIDHASEIRFPDRTVSLKINEKFCRLEIQGAREATRQEVAETPFKKKVRNIAISSTVPCSTAHLSADSDIGQQHHLERTAAMTGDKL
jgi:hypothetical protein